MNRNANSIDKHRSWKTESLPSLPTIHQRASTCLPSTVSLAVATRSQKRERDRARWRGLRFGVDEAVEVGNSTDDTKSDASSVISEPPDHDKGPNKIGIAKRLGCTGM